MRSNLQSYVSQVAAKVAPTDPILARAFTVINSMRKCNVAGRSEGRVAVAVLRLKRPSQKSPDENLRVTHLQATIQIYNLCQAGHPRSEIACILNRDKSTISRELHRNRGLRGYRPAQAHRLAMARRYGTCRRRCTPGAVGRDRAALHLNWRPEQIGARLKREQGVRIRHEWIYRYVYADQRSGGRFVVPTPALPEAAAQGHCERRERLCDRRLNDAQPASLATRKHLRAIPS